MTFIGRHNKSKAIIHAKFDHEWLSRTIQVWSFMALGLPKKGDSRDRNGDKQNNRDMVDMVSNMSLYKMTIGIFYLYVISAIFWVTTKGEKHML